MSEQNHERETLLLFGGTTEGRILAERLTEEGYDVLLSVATEYGEECAEAGGGSREGLRVLCGRLEERGMEELLAREKPALVIDATHPYAREVTEHIRLACSRRKTPLLRCLRERSRATAHPEAVYFDSPEEAAAWLTGQKGNVLLTTGSKELACFCQIADYRERLYVRVLPLEESVRVCRALGFSGRHILAVQGPFSQEMNVAQLREYGCRFLVTKDGGREGGFEEKLAAAAQAGARAAVIRRPEETGLSLEEIVERLKQRRAERVNINKEA